MNLSETRPNNSIHHELPKATAVARENIVNGLRDQASQITSSLTQEDLDIANSKCRHISLNETYLSAKLDSSGNLLTRRSKSPFSKSVKFADTCGKQLSHVLTFENFQEVDFTVHDSCEDFRNFSREWTTRQSFAPLFFLPPSNAVLEKAKSQNVKLENIQIFGLKLLGSVLVTNLGYYKEVTIRYTLNNWAHQNDLRANYVPGSEINGCERFSFEVEFQDWQIDDKVIFCIQYKSERGEFWDNNNGLNYTLTLLQH